MFRNCVFKPNVNTVKWAKAAGRRAVKTMAQTFIAALGTATVMEAVDWSVVGSMVILSGILSAATSVAGLPEVEAEENV